MPVPAHHTLRHPLQSRRGTAAIEFALIGGSLVTMMLFAVDGGSVVQQAVMLNEAVHAGGFYAQSFPTDTDGIKSAVAAALPSSWTDVTPNVAESCGGPGASWTDPNCTVKLVTVTAARDYTAFGDLVTITTTSASYVARIQ